MSVKRITWCLLIVLATAALAFSPGQSSAQTPAQAPSLVKWRYDYNLARREALEKKLPIFIDFYGNTCVYCVLLDNTTLRDPQVVTMLNEHFIPLKINGDVETQLTAALKINQYPSMVFAAYDGKILPPTLIGAKEAPEFYAHLQRVLGTFTEPEWMLREYQAAGKMVQNREYAQAVAKLLRIVEDGKARPVQVSARTMLQEIEVHGQERLAQARDLVTAGRTAEGIEAINETMQAYAGLQSAKDGSALLARVMQSPEVRQQQRTKRAQELLVQAQDFFKYKDLIPCLDRCEVLMASYGDMPQGAEAFQIASNIKNDPKAMQAATEVMGDRLAKMWMDLADTLVREGQADRARFYFERIIRAFPGSRFAESAQIRLGQLAGVPARRVEIDAANNRP